MFLVGSWSTTLRFWLLKNNSVIAFYQISILCKNIEAPGKPDEDFLVEQN